MEWNIVHMVWRKKYPLKVTEGEGQKDPWRREGGGGAEETSCSSYYTSLFFRLPTPSSDGQRHCLRSSQQADRRQMWDQGNGRKSQPPSLRAGCCARPPVGNTAVD
ncbi:unnamed protein product [Pleuronectes platessa]|uniref:Uncharacterized protein n=1 Tax=Pleuronectes platessa TaxID=8262 RepID=A0A9N7V2V2_PLEPL|nr:unnamed protein product [Pleuronectes platessa]